MGRAVVSSSPLLFRADLSV